MGEVEGVEVVEVEEWEGRKGGKLVAHAVRMECLARVIPPSPSSPPTPSPPSSSSSSSPSSSSSAPPLFWLRDPRYDPTCPAAAANRAPPTPPQGRLTPKSTVVRLGLGEVVVEVDGVEP